jgi:hypothetical protein
MLSHLHNHVMRIAGDKSNSALLLRLSHITSFLVVLVRQPIPEIRTELWAIVRNLVEVEFPGGATDPLPSNTEGVVDAQEDRDFLFALAFELRADLAIHLEVSEYVIRLLKKLIEQFDAIMNWLFIHGTEYFAHKYGPR